ncbi:MAG: class I SAM-dependent methyltransferase, partial [Proteobacteria bacterium]|nr:class I SAM-dependent methyltransferase [Pseudomonadota bacterium]
MISNHACQVCGNKSLIYLYKGIDRFYGVEGTFDLYRCDRCGLISIFPAPHGDILKRYYPSDYYSYISTEKAESEKGSVKQKASFYFRHPFKALNCILYSKLLKQKDLLCYKKGFNVLDIGCGHGKYLLDKKRHGCDCFGVDIDEKALKKLREKDGGVKTYCGNLWEAGLSNESFDVVNLDNVLEHIGEPEKVLSEVKRIMKKEAVLRVVVPNSASLTHRLFRKYWMGLDVPRHLYTFSIKNLKILFKNTGLTIQRYR